MKLDNNVNMPNGQQRTGFHNYFFTFSTLRINEKGGKPGQKRKPKSTKGFSWGPIGAQCK